MKYLCLIYDDESRWERWSEQQRAQIMKDYFAFTKEARDAGVFVGGDALQPTATATSVRVRDGQVLHTDGPFAETKEQLGGYYLLECADLDEAIAWAAKVPTALHGTIEVRPLSEYE